MLRHYLKLGHSFQDHGCIIKGRGDSTTEQIYQFLLATLHTEVTQDITKVSVAKHTLFVTQDTEAMVTAMFLVIHITKSAFRNINFGDGRSMTVMLLLSSLIKHLFH